MDEVYAAHAARHHHIRKNQIDLLRFCYDEIESFFTGRGCHRSISQVLELFDDQRAYIDVILDHQDHRARDFLPRCCAALSVRSAHGVLAREMDPDTRSVAWGAIDYEKPV